MHIMGRIRTTQDVKGVSRKTARLLTILYSNDSFRVQVPPSFQARQVQTAEHLCVFSVPCFETHSTGKPLQYSLEDHGP